MSGKHVAMVTYAVAFMIGLEIAVRHWTLPDWTLLVASAITTWWVVSDILATRRRKRRTRLNK